MFRSLSMDEMLELHNRLGRIEGNTRMTRILSNDPAIVEKHCDWVQGEVDEIAKILRIRSDDSDTRIEGVDTGDEETDRIHQPTPVGTGGEAQ